MLLWPLTGSIRFPLQVQHVRSCSGGGQAGECGRSLQIGAEPPAIGKLLKRADFQSQWQFLQFQVLAVPLSFSGKKRRRRRDMSVGRAAN
jgi:hypothetical protein